MRGKREQVSDQKGVMRAVLTANREHPSSVQKQNTGWFGCRDVDQERFPGDAGIRFSKNLSGPLCCPKGLPCPRDRSFQSKPSRRGQFPGRSRSLLPGKCFAPFHIPVVPLRDTTGFPVFPLGSSRETKRCLTKRFRPYESFLLLAHQLFFSLIAECP